MAAAKISAELLELGKISEVIKLLVYTAIGQNCGGRGKTKISFSLPNFSVVSDSQILWSSPRTIPLSLVGTCSSNISINTKITYYYKMGKA